MIRTGNRRDLSAGARMVWWWVGWVQLAAAITVGVLVAVVSAR